MVDLDPDDGADAGFSPEIRRARVTQLTIFEVSESELNLLEKGSPDSIYLNFAIFLLSTAIAFTVTLVTTAIESDRIFVMFVVLTVVGYLAGIILLVLWARTRSSVADCVRTIRKRLPPEGIFEELEQEPD